MNGDGSAAQGGPEKHQFQAEVAELLNLMIHSVYSETDVFLRELVSNASDACDKVRYEAIARPELLAGDERLAIRIKPDAEAKTLTIADNGIGMDRQELVDNLGTLARSGTKAFLKGLKDAKDGLGLIGQFGVGFYAAFMVADRIEVTSRRAGSNEAWTWTSASGAGFEVAPATEEQAARVARGTQIVLHLKEDAVRYLQPYELERIVRTYSDHVLFPIELIDDKGEARQVNAASALWQRSKSEVKPEDYTQAYRSLAMAFDEPALTLHYKVEGRQSYAVLLFVPSTPPFDLTDPARKGAGEALRPPGLHHRRCRAAAGLAALRARRGRQRGPAAQPVARDAAEQSAGPADPLGSGRARPVGAREHCHQGRRGLRQDLGDVRRHHQGRTVRGQ
jgi:molecular chaperone HtpG